MAAMLCMVAASGVVGPVTVRIAESKSPLQSEEEAELKHEEAVTNHHRRIRLHSAADKVRSAVPQSKQGSYAKRVERSGVVSGHRLSNGLLAPITC